MSSDEEDAAVSESEEEYEDDADEEEQQMEEDPEAMRRRNTSAMLSNNLVVERQPLMPRVLKVDAATVLRAAFKSPLQGAPDASEELKRRLASTRRFVPWGSSAALSLAFKRPTSTVTAAPDTAAEELPPEIQPLVLWTPPTEGAAPGARPITVDNMLLKWLRPHQREGVQFCFECVAGLRDYGGKGCILADDMGLGKTLQGITLLWTLLKQGFDGQPMGKRILIVCPTSLVSNWDQECDKFLKGRVRTVALSESSRADVIASMNTFLRPNSIFQVMIVSYETFRIHADKFAKEGSCDLLICDEAHRLKNADTLTNKALDKLPCRRRVLLSGTPLQNDLGEFYAMISFCNPGVLGTEAEFNKYYANPILNAREPDATDADRARGQERSTELSVFVNQFVIRRTNALLSAHLPPKVVEVVCCKLSPLQQALYNHFLASKATRAALNGGKATRVLPAINALRKLCNHPKLIYDMLHATKAEAAADGFQDARQFFPPGMFEAGIGKKLPMEGQRLGVGWEMLGGKFALLARMLDALRRDTKDRIVIVSNFTQTLGLVAQLCTERNYPYVVLDGSTSMKKRKDLVKRINDLTNNEFVFLLSSKAGGCGLNLIGANRLILFDPDWNPANDKQAAARVWRDGQRKRVYVYRFLSTGTLEEKIFQRQVSKEGLKSAVSSGGGGDGGDGDLIANTLSKGEMKKLFQFNADTQSDCHDGLKCKGCVPGVEEAAQVGKPSEEDLKSMGHHSTVITVPDAIMQRIGFREVSFVFTCEVAGKVFKDELEPSSTATATTPAKPSDTTTATTSTSGAATSATKPTLSSNPAVTPSSRPPAATPRRPLSSLHAAPGAGLSVRSAMTATTPSTSGRPGGAGTRLAVRLPKSTPQPKRAKATAPKAKGPTKKCHGHESDEEDDSDSSDAEQQVEEDEEEEEVESGNEESDGGGGGSEAEMSESDDDDQENAPPNVPRAPTPPNVRHTVAAAAKPPAKRAYPVINLDDSDSDVFQ